MELVVLSDIHANLAAFRAVLDHVRNSYGDDVCYVQLGDVVDYGPRPNEVVRELQRLHRSSRLLANLAGNHEAALLGDGFDRFSTGRGLAALDHTRGQLDPASWDYLANELSYRPVTLEVDTHRIVCVHGTLSDTHWGKMRPPDADPEQYREFDLVLSGHSHVPNLTEVFFADRAPKRRNKKKTVFLNPGSVGQPRNHVPLAQYAYIDVSTETFHLNKVAYDIGEEQRHFSSGVDKFYSVRLAEGV